ncbi:MAG TPA: PTS sucrose transporter subunit IIBC [Clostridiales bacterium]|nr:PTS sucrose transporter subunit IIBC [Clostridiales bacterium]
MELLKLENVQICEGASDWREAIRTAVLPLEKNGYVEPRYKEEIIGNVEKLGPYIVVADHVALPHARPEQGALKTQIGVTLFREEIPFENGESSAQLFVTLAASDSSSHLEALMSISELLGEEETVAKILASPDVETLYRYFE